MAPFGREWQKRFERSWWQKIIDVPLDALAFLLEVRESASFFGLVSTARSVLRSTMAPASTSHHRDGDESKKTSGYRK